MMAVKKYFFLLYLILPNRPRAKNMIIQKKGSIKNERIFDKTKNTLVNIINFGEIMYFKQNRFTNTQSVI